MTRWRCRMNRWLCLLTTLLLLAALAVGCGSESSTIQSATSTDAVLTTAAGSSGGSTTTTFYQPWVGPHETVTESDSTVPTDSSASTNTTVTVPIPGLEAYGAKMKAWIENFPSGFWSLSSPPVDPSAADDRMNASQQEIDAWRRSADQLKNYIGGLKDVTPPSQLSAAHADFIAGWEKFVQYFDELVKAIEQKNQSALSDADVTFWDALDLIKRADLVIGNALGYSLLPL
jgi:hypothetical protein